MSDSNIPKVEVKPDEKGLLLDHDYDGIRELNHPLPRWWLLVFYASIVFAAGYAAYYMLGPGPTVGQELEATLKKIYASRPKETEIVVDEKAIQNEPSNVDHAKLGSKVFSSRCTPCHGAAGQGGIGPNLTDDFWIHGTGSLGDIAKVVHDGVMEKGMPSWVDVLSVDEMKDVAFFVRSLRGTTPPNPKASQGTIQPSTHVGKNP